MRRWLLLPVLFLTVVGLAACGAGDDDDGLSAADAERIVQATLLSIDDLPEAAWVVDEDEEQEAQEEEGDDDDPFASAPSCQQFNDLNTSDIGGAIAGVTPLFSDDVDYQAELEDLLEQAQVFTAAAVYSSEADARTVIEAITDAIDPDLIGACFEGAFTMLEDFDVGEVEVAAASSEVDGAAATRVALEATIVIFPLNVTAEIHVARRGAAKAAGDGLGT